MIFLTLIGDQERERVDLPTTEDPWDHLKTMWDDLQQCRNDRHYHQMTVDLDTYNRYRDLLAAEQRYIPSAGPAEPILTFRGIPVIPDHMVPNQADYARLEQEALLGLQGLGQGLGGPYGGLTTTRIPFWPNIMRNESNDE